MTETIDTARGLPPLVGNRGVYLPEEAATYFGVPVSFVKFLGRHGHIPISAASTPKLFRFGPNHLADTDPALVRAVYGAFTRFGSAGNPEVIWKRRNGTGIQGLVYFVSDGTAIKIGYAGKSIAERIAILQCGNPRPLRLLGQIEGDVQFERAIHRHFKHLKIRNEWFRAGRSLTRFIEAIPAYSAALRTLLIAIEKAENSSP